MAADDLLNELWRQQSCWSQAANRMKQSIGRARAVALVAAILAAVAGTLAGVFAEPAPVAGRVLAGVAALAALSLPLLRPRWSGDALRDWTRARSVSEALKSEVHLFLAGTGDGDLAALRTRADAVREDGADLLRHLADLVPVQRPLPEVHDPASYFEVRVTGQIDRYYRPRSRALDRSLRRFKAASTGLAGIGVLLGAAGAVTGGASFAPWIAVLTTVTAALAVHVAATRNEYQLIEFLRTADRLERLRARARSTPAADLPALVAAAEDVISIENQGWMAKLAEDPDDQRGDQPGA